MPGTEDGSGNKAGEEDREGGRACVFFGAGDDLKEVWGRPY